MIQVDGIAPSLETNSYIENRIDNLTDVEEITDSEGSEEETNNLQISKTARRKRTKKVFSLLSAPTNDEESLTDCEQIDVEEENVKTNATLAELPNFYKPLKPQIIEVVDDPSGKVQINKITSGIIVRELADIAAAGISVPLLDADLGADDPLTDMDSIDGVSDYDGPGMEVELEQAILSRYDISGNTSEIHEQGPVSFTPGIIIHPAGASSSSNLKLPTISNEATTDTEEFGGSDDESSQKGRLYVVERNLGNLTDTEDIELDAGTPERNRTPSPLNGPLRRSVELQRVSIEEDELGKVLIRTDATRDKTPSPYLSVQSEENEVLTDLESYAASDSEDEQPRFQTPEVEMFDGANINVHDKELLLKVDTMSDNGSDISNDMEVNTTLQVPSSGKQPLTDTEDIETSDIDERNITVRDIKKEFCVCIPLRKSLREKCICRSQDGSLVQLKDADGKLLPRKYSGNCWFHFSSEKLLDSTPYAQENSFSPIYPLKHSESCSSFPVGTNKYQKGAITFQVYGEEKPPSRPRSVKDLPAFSFFENLSNKTWKSNNRSCGNFSGLKKKITRSQSFRVFERMQGH